MSGLYIWIARWEDFQHYRAERGKIPAWIKDYTNQILDERYLRLTDRQRALIRDLRDLFAMTRGRLADDARMIARRRHVHTRDADIEALSHAGLIEIISREVLEERLEQLYSRSRSRTKEKDLDVDLGVKERNGINPLELLKEKVEHSLREVS